MCVYTCMSARVRVYVCITYIMSDSYVLVIKRDTRGREAPEGERFIYRLDVESRDLRDFNTDYSLHHYTLRHTLIIKSANRLYISYLCYTCAYGYTHLTQPCMVHCHGFISVQWRI